MKYIDKEAAIDKLELLRGLVNANQELVVSQAVQLINELPTTANFNDKLKFSQEKYYGPIDDGDYLVYYGGYFNVFSFDHGTWFDQRGYEVTDTEDLWWQPLPDKPEE